MLLQGERLDVHADPGRAGEEHPVDVAVGDLDGALGLYREVIDRKGGEHRWWPNFIVPVLCKHLVAAKRRETLVELLERLRRAKGGTKESQDLFRIALGR